MYVLQKEVRLLRRISKKLLDEPMGRNGSPESEAGSHTEGTPAGHQHQWSMSREDSEEEGTEVSSEVRADCVYNCSTHYKRTYVQVVQSSTTLLCSTYVYICES